MHDPARLRHDADAADQFAVAVDTGDDPGGRFGTELAAVDALRRAGAETTLDADARVRVLHSVHDRAADPVPAQATRPAQPKRRRRRAVSRSSRRTASVLAAGTAAGVLAFGAMGIEMSDDALPGDLLYDVKRATESLSLDLTFSADGKANRNMQIAEKRLTELAELTERSDDGVSDRYRAVLDHHDATVARVAQQITTYATNRDGSDLHTLGAFATRHRDAITDLKSRVLPDVVPHLDSSLTLLRDVEERARHLLGRMDCTTITSGERDELGARPDDGPCTATEVPDSTTVAPRADTAPHTGSSGEPAPVTGNGSDQQPETADVAEDVSRTTDPSPRPPAESSAAVSQPPSTDDIGPPRPSTPLPSPSLRTPTEFGRG